MGSNETALQGLARSYHTLLYKNSLSALLNSYYFNKSNEEVKSKIELHGEINNILVSQYQGEAFFKWNLAKEFISKKVIAAFEVKVNGSRIDFLTINGDTRSFEIKSGRDTLKRLPKQTLDYLEVFEYNYLVTTEEYASKIMNSIDSDYGIWIYKSNRKVEVRPACRSSKINPVKQLSIISKTEKKTFFKLDSTNEILNHYSSQEINTAFKACLKKRYKKKWSFVVSYKDVILPIDLQFFFNSNVSPEIIYGG